MSELVTDTTLWERYKSGDQHAFGQLFQRHYPSLFQFGMKITSDSILLEDSIQELFIELWQNKKPTEVLSVKAYLLKALKYKLMRSLKKRNGNATNDLQDDMLFELSHETFLVERQENEERKKIVMGAFQQLSNRQKEIIYLKFYQNLSYEEVSEIMNINYQVARNLLYQSVKALKKILTALVVLWLVR
ncbi:RNA polymerase sigma factor [Pinibacter soli]|uniref:Sigma-70 family RNA polymerase sigma factor n=1 Tax=Pinibacter soli TaxID=3044211 RepID=A0ABT6RAZ1_9BACT|nr:sigma-70 family RNA polymerase sigma factor [Pinibacter soli]MDI3319737.1 sigma-70 family RNA polymerase sigma factor [Pinibacter soli]